MKKVCVTLIILFMMACASSQVFAQQQADVSAATEKRDDADKDKSTKDILASVFKGFSGQMFIQFKVDTLKDGDEATTFSLERAYLNYKRNIWGPISIKVTSDVGTKLKSDGEVSGDPVTVYGQAYEFFIKNAYVQVAHDWDFLGLNFKFGIIPTPSNAVVSKLQDLRWIEKCYSFMLPSAVGVVQKDTSADVGVSLTTRIFSYVVLNYAFCHGEGYKHPVESYDGKSHYGTISVIPYKGIYLNGFINYEKYEATKTYFYYGAGAAYKSDFLKAGANFIVHGNKITDISVAPYTAKAQKYHLVEAWVHFFMGHFVKQAPVIMVGRFAYGKHIESTKNNFTRLLSGGVGYKFNKYFRVLAYYESYKKKGESGDAAFYVKTEARF